MADYLAWIKHLCDSLVGCDEPIPKEQKSAILNGFSAEYENVVSIITTSRLPFDLQSITTTLLDAEARQKALLSQVTISTNVAVNNTQPSGTINQPSLLTYTGPPSFWRDQSPTRNGYSTFRGRGKAWFGGSSWPQCQLYGWFGHVAIKCFYRYEPSFNG